MSQDTISLKKNPAAGSSTVTVASKMPMPFVLRLYDWHTRHEPVMGGGSREYKISEPRLGAPEYVINGNSFAQNQGPQCQITGGYAITRDIPKDFWDEWYDTNKDAAFIKNGMIFAHGEAASVLAKAAEYEGKKSNIERLDPDKLPKGIKTADEKRAA